MTVWLASGNAHKKKELGSILAIPDACTGIGAEPEHKFMLKIPADAGLTFDPEENGDSFHENALIKAMELHRLLLKQGLFNPGDAVIADDSGICVDALDGRPGIYSARYTGLSGGRYAGPTENQYKKIPHKDHKDTKEEPNFTDCTPQPRLTDSERNTLLLGEMAGKSQRSARFVCAIALVYSADNYYIAQETLEGRLAESPGGNNGFGYDPILFIPELGCTVAELSEAEKNRISHRARAARAIAKILINNSTTLTTKNKNDTI